MHDPLLSDSVSTEGFYHLPQTDGASASDGLLYYDSDPDLEFSSGSEPEDISELTIDEGGEDYGSTGTLAESYGQPRQHDFPAPSGTRGQDDEGLANTNNCLPSNPVSQQVNLYRGTTLVRQRRISKRTHRTKRQRALVGRPLKDNASALRHQAATGTTNHLWLLILLVLSTVPIILFVLNDPSLSSLCSLPGAPTLALSLCNTSTEAFRTSHGADFPFLMEITRKAFEDSLIKSAEASESIALEMTMWEMTAQDLATMVRHTKSLKRGKELEKVLLRISNTGNALAYRMPEFGTRIWGTFRSISHLTEWALQSLEDTESKVPSTWSPMNLIPARSRDHLEKVMYTEFTNVLSGTATYMEELQLEALDLQNTHNQLREDIRHLGELIQGEQSAAEKEQSDFKADPIHAVWMLFGGGTEELRRFEERFQVLQDTRTYKVDSATLVAANVDALAVFKAQIREVRRNIASPGLVGKRIPYSGQMKIIRESVAWGTGKVEAAEAKRSGDINSARNRYAERRGATANERPALQDGQ